MHLRVQIPAVEPRLMKAPKECPYEDCHSGWFKTHLQRRDKILRDTKCNQVQIYRQERPRCNRTHRVYP
jgi:hypothetical protein